MVVAGALEQVSERVRELRRSYDPPGFEHVPGPDAALFLCAVDHRTGYEAPHRVDGRGPFSGSELMWELGLRRAGQLRADALADVRPTDVKEWFAIDGESVADPARRAELWRDLAAGLLEDHGGEAAQLLAACEGRLGGDGGLLRLLGAFDAYADPLAKKVFLFAKICERRGWLAVADPECWEVCADNVLMRLALRSGLVGQGEREEVRAATRAALREVASESGVAPPVLDDMLWELGRDDPDLLGRAGGDEREPPRDPASAWY